MDKTVYKTYKNPTDDPWNSLSMADKAAMMEVAIRNGITTLPEIREAYNEFAKGGNLYELGGPKSNSYDKPQTFMGRVAQVLGASPYNSRGMDVVSSIAQTLPKVGPAVSALDLGYDLNRAYHGEKGALADAGLDILGMLPYISKGGIKAGRGILDAVRGNEKLRKAWNISVGTAKASDFISDTLGADRTSDVNNKKKSLGGNLYPDGGYVRSTNDHPVAFDSEGNLVDQVTGETGTMRFPEILLTADPDDVARGRAQRWYRDFGIESNDATSAAYGRRQNSHLDERGAEGATKAAGWAKDHPVLNSVGLGLGAAPFAVAAAPVAVGGGELVGQALANPYVDAGLTSYFGAHGLQSLANGEADWTTALEIAPLGRLAKPILNEAALAVENYRYPFGRPQVPESYITVKPQIRTRIGDVEIDNPNLLYHLDRGDSAGAFSNQGAYVKDGRLLPGIAKEGEIPYSWWNLGRPYATSVNGQPMTRLMTTTKDTPGMLHIRSQNYPIGQWNGKRGLVTNAEYVNPEGVSVSESTYTLDPDYGWRRVFTEDAPTAKWADAVKTPQITAENAAKMADANDFSYKGLTSNMSDFFEKMTYNNKIHGKPMVPSDEGIGGFSKSVQVGIPKTEYDELLHDVIGRNIREFKRAGLSDAQVSNYINNAKDAMDNVRIGMYSNSDYIKGGWEGFGGFYDSEGNFISVNTGSPLSKTKVVKHEGRHLLDHKVDDEILMPASENFGKDFDSDMAFSTMQKVKQNQNMTLYDAYDNDFITLPSKKGFNEGLEGYPNMDREAITTNLDSRNELLGSKADWDLDITDKIIDKMPDDAVFEAVEKANGYGRRYIRFLRDNNKLTPEKAQQFREAMKHIGAAAVPIGLSYMSSGNENAYGGNLYPYGGTKKQAFLSSLDQSLKEDNRFDSAEWRQFFTDLADMESGYSSNITNSIGAKGYFQLMPFNRAKAWKNPTQQFHEMYKLTGNNLNYLNKNLTKEDWKRADALGIDMYGMLAGAHLGGAGNVLKALRGKGNAKDMNGSSVMGYMTRFSQRGKTPTLATPSYVEEVMPLFTPSNPEVFFGGYKAPEIEAPLPSVELEDTPQYSEEEIARQERRERLNNLSMLMSLTSPQGSSNSMLDALGLLMR